MNQFNGQFLYDTPATAPAPKRKLSLKQRLAKRTTFLTGTAAIVLGSIVGATVGGGVAILAFNYIQSPAPIVVNNAKSVTWVTAAAGAAQPSVVTISVSSGADGGNGSGEFLTEDGYILTNTHVVTLDGATANPSIEVKTYDGHVYSAKLIGTDPTNDLAVIKIDANTTFTPIKFADSDKINVGDSVVAIGAPLGLSNTVTQGIVSALNRTIAVSSAAAPQNGSGGGLQLWNNQSNVAPINLDVIQTDAAINPGNSGGALVNQVGELVGVNVAIASAGSTVGQSGNIGVGFAIPSNTAKRIATEIMKSGKASHALLGAQVSDSTNSTASASFTVGALVRSVTPGSAAAVAGIKANDVIVKFNDRAITSAGDLMAAVRQQPAGATAAVEYVRGSQHSTVSVKLGDAANLN
jgi:putative serine protease PepD